MTRREMLMEQYEDALFALIMDEVAEVEGQKALEENQRLKESGELVIPEEVSQRCQRVIARKTAEKDLKRFAKGFGRVVTKVAVVALMGMLLFTTAFAASEDFRVKTLNFVMEVFDDRTEIRFVPENMSSDASNSVVPRITAGWLPEGFELVSEECSEYSIWYEFAKLDTEESISVNIMNMVDANTIIDTENADMRSVKVQGTDALLVDTDGIKQLAWQLFDGREWYIQIITRNVSTEDLLMFAKNITSN